MTLNRFLFFWILLLLSIVILAFGLSGIAMDCKADVDVGALTDSYELLGTGDYLGAQQYSGYGIRQMNGTLWQFKTYRNPADTTDRTFYGYFSNNGGDSWDQITILTDEDPLFGVGDYPELIWGAVALSNNSIILGTFLYGVTQTWREISFYCHWNNSDLSQWERVFGWSSGVAAPHDPGMGVNDSDKILFAFDNNVANLYSCSFDPATRTVASVGDKGVNNLCPAVKTFWEPDNARWTIVFQYEPGTGDRLYIYDEDLTSELYIFWVGATRSISDVVMLLNETYVWIYNPDTGGAPYIGWWDSTTDDEGSTSLSGVAQWSTRSFRIAISNKFPDRLIKVYGYEYLNDEFHEWPWLYPWSDEGDFQSGHKKWWEETSDWVSGKNYVDWAPYSLYPQLYDPINDKMVYTQLPNNGTYCTFTEFDPDNDPDFWVTYNDPAPNHFPWIPWFINPPPEITTVALDSGTVDVYYYFLMSAINGDPPLTWSLVTAPAWLDIEGDTGLLYGTPTSEGTYQVRVRVTDDPGRYDTELYTLKINVQEAELGPPGRKMDFPISIDTLMGAMWWIFIVLAMFIAVMDVIVKVRNKASRRFQ